MAAPLVFASSTNGDTRGDPRGSAISKYPLRRPVGKPTTAGELNTQIVEKLSSRGDLTERSIIDYMTLFKTWYEHDSAFHALFDESYKQIHSQQNEAMIKLSCCRITDKLMLNRARGVNDLVNVAQVMMPMSPGKHPVSPPVAVAHDVSNFLDPLQVLRLAYLHDQLMSFICQDAFTTDTPYVPPVAGDGGEDNHKIEHLQPSRFPAAPAVPAVPSIDLTAYWGYVDGRYVAGGMRADSYFGAYPASPHHLSYPAHSFPTPSFPPLTSTTETGRTPIISPYSMSAKGASSIPPSAKGPSGPSSMPAKTTDVVVAPSSPGAIPALVAQSLPSAKVEKPNEMDPLKVSENGVISNNNTHDRGSQIEPKTVSKQGGETETKTVSKQNDTDTKGLVASKILSSSTTPSLIKSCDSASLAPAGTTTSSITPSITVSPSMACEDSLTRDDTKEDIDDSYIDDDEKTPHWSTEAEKWQDIEKVFIDTASGRKACSIVTYQSFKEHLSKMQGISKELWFTSESDKAREFNLIQQMNAEIRWMTGKGHIHYDEKRGHIVVETLSHVEALVMSDDEQAVTHSMVVDAFLKNQALRHYYSGTSEKRHVIRDPSNWRAAMFYGIQLYKYTPIAIPNCCL